MKTAYLIGHGNRKLAEFIGLLKERKIKSLIDVRSIPYSRFAYQFNREYLRKCIEKESITYIYMGDSLGGRREEGFEEYIKSKAFKNAIAKLIEIIRTRIIAIMCAETDYSKCHRRFIGEELSKQGFSVENIGQRQKKIA